jgi:hypothetical protein
MKKYLFLIFIIVLINVSKSTLAQNITLTATTADNGLAARSITWKDANNLQRNAILVDQRAAGAGYLRQFTYKVSGVDRVCRGTGANGHQGDGYTQNHTVYGGDNSSHGTAGTTSIPLNGAHHSIVDFYMPNYYINPSGTGASNGTVPTRIQWFFATGRDYPIFSITQDARGIAAGNLGADCRSPYGDMHYDGTTNYSSPYTGDLIGGASWGDTRKWVTLTNGTLNESTQATTNSGWRYDELNTIPYAMQWTKNIDAEQGRVLTQPITVKDMGQNSFPALANVQTPNGPMIADGQWCYQILNYGIIDAGGGVTKRLTWGTNWGYPGGFDEWGGSPSKTDFTKHSNGARTNGMLLAFSLFDVFGTHTGGYKNGATGKMVKQMGNMAQATLSASIGTVITSGPAGVGLASNVANNVTYVPSGYNHVYATWEVNAASNIATATLTPAALAPIENPVFVINNFTAGSLGTVCINNVAATNNTDYFATIDASNSKAWITLNRTITAPTTLKVNANSCGVLPIKIISFTGENKGDATTLLSWKISNEIEAKYFEIEKSIDGSAFTSIAKVNAANLASYTILDTKTANGNNYYRLKVMDNNGSITYSNSIKIWLATAPIIIKQNEEKQTIIITTNEAENATTLLYNMQGKIVLQFSFTKTKEFSIADIASGMYYISVAVGNKKENKMILKK